MLKKIIYLGFIALSTTACQDIKVGNDEKTDVREVPVNKISDEMSKVRDYIPQYVTVAHRGSTFWTPEETEAAYRWAREIGADYLEADLQVTKDGVILALHDDNLKRTTDIEKVYGETVPSTRKQYYIDLGYSDDEAEKLYKQDVANFVPNLTSYYTYSELLTLDAGSWFNQDYPEQARQGFTTHRQYISSLEDLVAFSKGKKLKRNGKGERVYTIIGKTGDKVTSLSGTSDVVEYRFEYEDDTRSGNIPGIYVEFKESWLNPKDLEQRVFDLLDKLDMNIITKAEDESNAPYVDGKINIGNTNGKVILQSFSFESLERVNKVFKGQVPMCFLLWEGTGANDIKDVSPVGYASFINLAIANNAHIIGPSISGAPNNYSELNAPWQAYMIKKSGLLNHPYSFDTSDQMNKYFGNYNYGNSSSTIYPGPYFDGAFTNRAEMTIDFLIHQNVRHKDAPKSIQNSNQLLTELGY